MTETCERCQARLGELLQWEIEHPATTALASAAAPAPAPPLATLAPANASRDGVAPPVVARFANGSSAPVASVASVAAELQEPDQAEATPEELRELWQHAQECPECRSALSLLRGARQVLVELPELAPPPELRARIQSQLTSTSGVAATKVATIQTKTAEIASSKALSDVRQPEHGKPVSRWAFWNAANASSAANSGAAGPTARRGGMPRAVWAGGGALVAAFCVLMALQLKPPPGPMGASAPQVDSAPVLDGAQSPDAAAQSSAPSTSKTANGAVKAVPTLGAPGKAPGQAPGKARSGIDGPPAALPDPNAGLPDPNVAPPAPLPNPNRPAQSKPQSKPEAGAAPSADLPPSMPEPKIWPLPGALPDPSTSKPAPKSQAAPNLRAASPKERSEPNPRAQAGPSDSNRSARALATRPLAAAPAKVQAPEAAPAKAREEAATIRVQVAPLPSRGDSNAAGNGSAAPIQEPQSDSSTAGSIAQSPDSTASAGGMEGGAASAPRRRSNKVRGGSDSEEPAAESATSGPQSASPADLVPPTSAPPAPAPGGAGGFSVAPSTNADSSESLSTSGAGSARSARRLASPKAASKLEATVRRISVEVKATRAIRRAQVEVVLSEGWLFAEDSKRVMWSGRASAGQVIRFEVALKAARPGAPARAARVRLVDAARARSASAILSSADIVIPSTTDSDSKN